VSIVSADPVDRIEPNGLAVDLDLEVLRPEAEDGLAAAVHDASVDHDARDLHAVEERGALVGPRRRGEEKERESEAPSRHVAMLARDLARPW
jgi:hypothetical protein